jgi:hypothetical protein
MVFELADSHKIENVIESYLKAFDGIKIIKT